MKTGKHSKGKRSYRATLKLKSSHPLLHPVSNEGTATLHFQALGAARITPTVPAGRKRVQVKYRLKSLTLADVPVVCTTYPTSPETESIVVTQRTLPRLTIPINEVEKVSWLTPGWLPESVSPGAPSGQSAYDLVSDSVEPVPGYVAGYVKVEAGLGKRSLGKRALYGAVEAQVVPDEHTLCVILEWTPKLYHLPL
jgi:hypothetical protein